jgi:glutamate formiminotransferase
VIECVVNVSEGTDTNVLADLARACGDDLLDVHTDPHHNRSVFTLVGTDAPRRLAARAVAVLDLRRHHGVHPRIGVVDVVPFVALDEPAAAACAARDEFCRWAADTLELPCFTYGPERTLPEVRRLAFRGLDPTTGPPTPHPAAGAAAVGCRPVLVAYNVWLPADQLPAAQRVATAVRSDAIRALGLQVGDRVQVSMNLIQPESVGPAEAYDAVAAAAANEDLVPTGAELVGLLPAGVLGAIDPQRWDELDVSESRTIEHRLALRAQRTTPGDSPETRV